PPLTSDEVSRVRALAQQRRWLRQLDVAPGRALAALDGASARIARARGGADRAEARRVLLEISRAANEDRSFEEMLAIPAAHGVRSRSDFVQ
ncbi:MAG: hypothetical protein KIS78_36150, partial [Labilithrix sp.]|nr:hypothetical protein [Labilithrix sp.]